MELESGKYISGWERDVASKNIVMKMSKKTVPLPSRPEPPSVDEIVQDIDNAEPDDVVFTLLQDQIGRE